MCVGACVCIRLCVLHVLTHCSVDGFLSNSTVWLHSNKVLPPTPSIPSSSSTPLSCVFEVQCTWKPSFTLTFHCAAMLKWHHSECVCVCYLWMPQSGAITWKRTQEAEVPLPGLQYCLRDRQLKSSLQFSILLCLNIDAFLWISGVL